jgi:hypothetical protein
MTYLIGNRSGAVKTAVRDIKPTLDTEQERLRVFGAQQPAGWASVRIAQLAMQTVTVIEDFVERVDEAQALLDKIRPALDESVAHIRARKAEGAKILADVESLQDYVILVDRARKAFLDLEHYLALHVETWLTVAKECGARTAEAACRAVTSAMVVDMSTVLQQMAERVQALRNTTSPALREVPEAIRKAERVNKLPYPHSASPLPVEWPSACPTEVERVGRGLTRHGGRAHGSRPANQ